MMTTEQMSQKRNDVQKVGYLPSRSWGYIYCYRNDLRLRITEMEMKKSNEDKDIKKQKMEDFSGPSLQMLKSLKMTR